MAQGTTKGVPIDLDPLLTNNSDLLVPSQKAIKTYADTGLSNKVNRAGDTMSGNLILNANPTAPLGAATKDYVDTLINGIDWKASVNAATTTALPSYTVGGGGQTLTGTGPLGSIDGVTLTANQRLLVKNETSTNIPNNGIYVVTQVNPFILTRASDANTSILLAEATVSVAGGSTLSNTQWHCNPASIPITIGTTNITFAQIGSGVYTASSPLGITGNIISLTGTVSVLNGGTGLTSYTVGDMLYASASNTISKVSGNTSTTKKFLSQTGTGTASNAPIWDTISASSIDLTVITGDVTFSSGSVSTIGANKVIFSKMQTIAAQTILGNKTASSGNIAALLPQDVATLLPVFGSSTKGVVPAATTPVSYLFLAADGSWQRISTTGIADQPAKTIIANLSATTDQVDAVSIADITPDLNTVVGDTGSGGTKGIVPAPTAGSAAAGKVLKANGSWDVPTHYDGGNR